MLSLGLLEGWPIQYYCLDNPTNIIIGILHKHRRAGDDGETAERGRGEGDEGREVAELAAASGAGGAGGEADRKSVV